MSKRSVFPLVLCGGMGSRLWPMSRVDQPKQFQPTSGPGTATFFQSTLMRHRGQGYEAPIVVTNYRHGPIVNRQMSEVQMGGTVIAEPVGRNTGPAVLAAALTLLDESPDALMLVLPSDHVVKGDMDEIVQEMTGPAEDGRIIVFGVPPRYAETGYGYITDGGASALHDGLHEVQQFVEKPPVDLAQSLVDGGRSYWASGISLFRADVLVEEYRRFDPATSALVEAAVARAARRYVKSARDHILLDEETFRQARSEPTERAVFEVTERIGLAKMHGIEWDDVGAWSAVHRISGRDEMGNRLSGDVVAIDTRNSLIQAAGRLVAVIGMEDVVVVDTPDALLVTQRGRAQDVKALVERLQAESRDEASSHVVRDTSWGQVEVLTRAPGYDMRIITINPGEALSILGTGIGPSLLTVISGQADCDVKGGQSVRMVMGHSLSITADQSLSVYNPRADELKMIQIMFVGEASTPQVLTPRAEPAQEPAAPQRATDSKAVNGVRSALAALRAFTHPEHGLAAQAR